MKTNIKLRPSWNFIAKKLQCSAAQCKARWNEILELQAVMDQDQARDEISRTSGVQPSLPLWIHHLLRKSHFQTTNISPILHSQKLLPPRQLPPPLTNWLNRLCSRLHHTSRPTLPPHPLMLLLTPRSVPLQRPHADDHPAHLGNHHVTTVDHNPSSSSYGTFRAARHHGQRPGRPTPSAASFITLRRSTTGN